MLKKIEYKIDSYVWNKYIWHKYKKMIDTVVVIGDSHVNFFSGNEELTYQPIGKGINYCKNVNHDFDFLVFHLGPALAYNAMTEGSNTRFYEKSQYLAKHFRGAENNMLLRRDRYSCSCIKGSRKTMRECRNSC